MQDGIEMGRNWCGVWSLCVSDACPKEGHARIPTHTLQQQRAMYHHILYPSNFCTMGAGRAGKTTQNKGGAWCKSVMTHNTTQQKGRSQKQ